MEERRRSICSRASESGQVLVLGLVFIVGLTLAAFTVANVGMMIGEKVRAQNAVDAAAYSAATVQARYMNLTAYVNRAIVANYNSLAFDMALWSTVDSYDHGSAAGIGLVYALVTALAETVIVETVSQAGKDVDHGFHRPMHAFNKNLERAFRFLKLNHSLERFNTDILSVYQGMLFAASQGLRHSVIKSTAAQIDPDLKVSTVLALGTEAMNYDELKSQVDYVVKNPNRSDSNLTKLNRTFDQMAGDGAPREASHFLGAVTEASLDRFTAGRVRGNGEEDLLRSFNTGNLIHGAGVDAFLNMMLGICKAAELVYEATHWSSFHCYSDLKVHFGGEQRFGAEKSLRQKRAPIISNERIREVNTFGIRLLARIRKSHSSWFNFGHLIGGTADGPWSVYGYTSGPEETDAAHFHNIQAYADRSRLNECEKGDHWWSRFAAERTRECFLPSTSECTLNKINACLSQQFFGQLTHFERTIDAHWDGTFGTPVVQGTNPIFGEIDSPPAGYVIPYYIAQMARVGGGEKSSRGAPPYTFNTKLERVGIPVLTDQNNSPERRTTRNSRGGGEFSGPSIGVIGVKAPEVIRGLGFRRLVNPHPITAMARAQVYYQKNRNRPEERPSMFNPHWAARLAPISTNDAPPLFRDILPYLTSGGIPERPTH